LGSGWLPIVSLIVPAYNAADSLPACLAALKNQTWPEGHGEIIVVDDGSGDATADIATKAGAVVIHIPHGGPAAARNAGVAAARGEIILFTDADCEPSPEWVERMTGPFRDPEVVGAKGTYRTRQHSLLARLVQREYEIRYQRMARLPYIDFIDTYSAAYRRSVFNEYGGFDVAYPIPSAEDVDLAFRIARDGHRLVFVPQGWVWHSHPTSLWRYLARKWSYGYWRALLYLHNPGKIGGDAHTDPALKVQFLLFAVGSLTAVGGLAWHRLWWGTIICALLLLVTSVPFVRWAWRRDRAVALLWPWVTLLRVFVQGTGLGIGLVVHSLGLFRARFASVPEIAAVSDPPPSGSLTSRKG